MTPLEKRAAKAKLAASLGDIIYGPMARVARVPGDLVSGGVGGLMFGPKQWNPMHPMYGKRLKEVPGQRGLDPITRGEYAEIKAGMKPGKAYKATMEGHTLPQYYKRKFVPGGVVGFARNHPILTGGGALLAYYLAKNPDMRQVAASVAPRPNTDISPETIRQWRSPDVENPFQRRAWG